MTRVLGLMAASALALLAAAPVCAQSADTDGSAEIVEQFALSEDSPLAFGTVLPPTAGSNSVTVSPAGARALGGGGNAQLIGSSFSAASYTVEGNGGQAFDIDVPATFDMTRSGGSETITVTLTPSAAGGTLSGTSGNPGSAQFTVGGSFVVGTATAVGLYQGTFTVTVDNN